MINFIGRKRILKLTKNYFSLRSLSGKTLSYYVAPFLINGVKLLAIHVLKYNVPDFYEISGTEHLCSARSKT